MRRRIPNKSSFQLLTIFCCYCSFNYSTHERTYKRLFVHYIFCVFVLRTFVPSGSKHNFFFHLIAFYRWSRHRPFIIWIDCSLWILHIESLTKTNPKSSQTKSLFYVTSNSLLALKHYKVQTDFNDLLERISLSLLLLLFCFRNFYVGS